MVKRIALFVLTVCMLLLLFTPVVLSEEKPEDMKVTLLFNTTNSLRPAMATTKVWDYIYQGTGIRFEIMQMQGQEQIQLMFAGRDYPDMIAAVGATSSQLIQAAEAGDLVDLWPYLEKYAPTWAAFFKNNPIAYNMQKINGSIYTLPAMAQSTARTLRDQWFYVDTWLKELGLKVPETTQEFKDTLLAIKNAGGTGTIPENVIPYYYLFDSYVGGQFDVYGSFGVLVTSEEYLVVDSDGVVRYQGINPHIKDALKYLQELYRLGLTKAESFTDDWNSYLSRISSNPPVVFSYHGAANRLPSVTLPMAAPSCEIEGRSTYIRPQALTANPLHAVAVFASCQNVERIAQFFEWSTQYDNAMTMYYGLEGVVWDHDQQGRWAMNFWETNIEKMNANADSLGLHNSWFILQDKNFYENHYYDPLSESLTSKDGAIMQIYRAQFPPWDCVYLSGTLDEESTTIMLQLGEDINQYRSQQFATWITTDADIDAQWDAYVAQIKALGLDEWLALKQAGYDLLLEQP